MRDEADVQGLAACSADEDCTGGNSRDWWHVVHDHNITAPVTAAWENNVTLAEEIQVARKKVVTDGYDMSLGEVLNLYRDDELIIDPVFQRLFRWDDERKTRFIESIILGIPIPSIFVSQNENGVWELIDGLQRVSTVLQLTGELRGERAEELGPLILMEQDSFQA